MSAFCYDTIVSLIMSGKSLSDSAAAGVHKQSISRMLRPVDLSQLV